MPMQLYITVVYDPSSIGTFGKVICAPSTIWSAQAASTTGFAPGTAGLTSSLTGCESVIGLCGAARCALCAPALSELLDRARILERL